MIILGRPTPYGTPGASIELRGLHELTKPRTDEGDADPASALPLRWSSRDVRVPLARLRFRSGVDTQGYSSHRGPFRAAPGLPRRSASPTIWPIARLRKLTA